MEHRAARARQPDDHRRDLDLFVGTEEGRIYFFTNVGTRTEPVFTSGRVIVFHEYMDQRAGVRVADFDGDGLLDFVPGRYWERTQWGEQPRLFYFGGNMEMRGYNYLSFVGSKGFFANAELRIPLIEAMLTPIGIMGPVRGVAFGGVGAAPSP